MIALDLDTIFYVLSLAALVIGVANRWYVKAKADGKIDWNDLKYAADVFKNGELTSFINAEWKKRKIKNTI